MAEALDKKGAFEDEGLEGRAHETLEREFNEVSSGRSYISSIYISMLHFNQVLQELVGDKSLERFRIEYEKLHRALKKSHGACEGAGVHLRGMSSQI